MKMKLTILCLAFFCLFSCKNESKYDIIIKNGLIYDGNGGNPYQADIAVKADTIAIIGDLSKETAAEIVDAKGMAISPGFCEYVEPIR